MVDGRNPLLGRRIGIVEPRHLFDEPRIDVVEGAGQPMGKALLDMHVEAVEIRVAGVEILFEDASAAIPTGGTVAHGPAVSVSETLPGSRSFASSGRRSAISRSSS